MAGLFDGSRVRLDVDLYAEDVIGLMQHANEYDVTTHDDDGPSYVAGVRRWEVKLSSSAAHRIGQALMQALAQNAEIRPTVEKALAQGRRGIDFGLGVDR